MPDIEIVLPECSEDAVCTGLREITKHLQGLTGEGCYGFLGGEHGYGVDYENDVFEMHPFWWGDCECGWEAREAEEERSRPHKSDCYQEDLLRRGAFNYEWDFNPNFPSNKEFESWGGCNKLAEVWGLPRMGSFIHCTCGRDEVMQKWVADNPHPLECPAVRPNFRFKPTGAEVRWYKYIGRGMEINGSLPLDFHIRCIKSSGVSPVTKAEAITAYEALPCATCTHASSRHSDIGTCEVCACMTFEEPHDA